MILWSLHWLGADVLDASFDGSFLYALFFCVLGLVCSW